MAFKYRADHVGSFLRPAEILEARADASTTPEQLRAIEDKHILEVLRRQQDLGFKVFTDGELRRRTFMSDFNEAVDGVAEGDAVPRQWSGQVSAGLGVAVGKISQKRRMTKHELDFLKQHAPGDIKMTLPSVNQFPAILYRKGLTDQHYPTYSDFLWDLVPIVKSEIKALVEEGVKYIQIDAPRYSYYIDPKWRDYVQNEMGLDPEQALDEAIRADNECIADARREGVVFCIHLCRGNNRSQWYAEGGYDPIAEKLFNQLDMDAYSLEYETERAGTFEPLRFVPGDKRVILGLISSKVAELESQEEIVRRIEEASKHVPLDNLAVQPQCGFASMMEGNLLSHEEQWRKMQLVADVARQVWGTT